MPAASYVQSSFIGGLVSKWAQGRYHDQHYRTWMETCLNGFPVETESWVRRPGFGLVATTRSGVTGRLIRFDFESVAPYTIELTDGHARFFQGNILVANDSAAVASISAANPAVVTLSSAVTWSTGDQAYFVNLVRNPTIENRVVTLTKLTTTTFSIADAVTGNGIPGALINIAAQAPVLRRVLDISTGYSGGAWQNIRMVQTGISAFFLHPNFAPQQLTVTTEPTPMSFASFSTATSFFEDGPYLDPIAGSTITPGATSGIITLTLGFQAYSATTAYTTGDFVTSSGIGYESIADANVNNTPVSSPTFWKVVGFGAAINNGAGFVASDIGRLVRLFSEPALWASGTTYGIGALVSYNPSNIPGGETYYQSLTSSNVGNVPGTDAKNWQLLTIGGNVAQINNSTTLTINALTPALWTWGKITSLSATGAISGATGTNIGTMTGAGGLAAAFDGVTSKASGSCAKLIGAADGFVGKNYTGSPNAISQAVVYPSNNNGFAETFGVGLGESPVRVRLWAKATSPSGPQDGTLLADSGVIANTVSPLTLVSNDNVTTWNFVWIEVLDLGPGLGTGTEDVQIAQVTFYNASAAPGTSINCEILGPALLYSGVTIQTWRLGLYSNTTGFPTAGTYAEGRLWLTSSAFPNRIDACVADGISGVNNGAPPGTVNFAPTDQYGNVTNANAIAYTFNSPAVDAILWMIPDLQGVLCGTLSGEWIVQAPSSGGISPTNIVARRMTVIGCANIEPRRTEHTIVYVQRYLRKIVEYFADVFSGKFSAPNLSKDAKQLTIGNIQEIAYQQELAPILWARVNNGLIGCTYKRDTLMTSSGPTMMAWHQHRLGSNRQIESLVVGSSVNGTLDALTTITNDPVTTVRFVEMLSPILDEGALQSAAPYLDSAIVPTSTQGVAVGAGFPYGGLQLNGLWNLNGYTVTAWLGGLDCGDYIVSNGSIKIPYGDGIGAGQGSFPAGAANRNDQGLFTSAFVSTGVTANGTVMFTGTIPTLAGFTYTSQGRIVRPNAPAESGARSGPAFAKKRRSQWIMMQLEGSQGVSWGTKFDSSLQPVRFAQPNGQAYTIDLQFSGIVRDNPHADYDFDNMLAWQVTRPFICNVQAIGAALETQDI